MALSEFVGPSTIRSDSVGILDGRLLLVRLKVRCERLGHTVLDERRALTTPEAAAILLLCGCVDCHPPPSSNEELSSHDAEELRLLPVTLANVESISEVLPDTDLRRATVAQQLIFEAAENSVTTF